MLFSLLFNCFQVRGQRLIEMAGTDGSEGRNSLLARIEGMAFG